MTSSELRALVPSYVDSSLSWKELTNIFGEDNVWSKNEVIQDFEFIEEHDHILTWKRRSDGVMGIMLWQRDPRYYFNFVPDSV